MDDLPDPVLTYVFKTWVGFAARTYRGCPSNQLFQPVGQSSWPTGPFQPTNPKIPALPTNQSECAVGWMSCQPIQFLEE